MDLDGLFAPLQLPAAGLHGAEWRDAADGAEPDPDAFRGVTRLRLPTAEETALALSKLPPKPEVEDEDDF